MGRKLYMVWGSPPVNAVLMTAKALNVELELQEIDFEKKEMLEDWFLQVCKIYFIFLPNRLTLMINKNYTLYDCLKHYFHHSLCIN